MGNKKTTLGLFIPTERPGS